MLRYWWDRIRIELALVFAPGLVVYWILEQEDADGDTDKREG